MPYNPTRILRSNSNIYVFESLSQTSTQFRLNSLDLSSDIDAGNLPYTTLYPTLPFLDDNVSRAFTPVLENGGNLTIYTGDCSQGAAGGQVWSYKATPAGSNGKGTWKQENISVQSDQNLSKMGANYLSGGVAFSSIVGGDITTTGAYFFGGMCPFENATTGEWQSSANYSNLMVTLLPSDHSDVTTLTYDIDTSASRGPPIPEAGFTMTGLAPTFSNRSDGSQTQQQNFVLVGGHTSSAFINMSQLALFSLPEQSWTFITVEQPDMAKTDLAIRTGVRSIDPRSGHTAVLTADGQRIVVFGGWVGDMDTPADPQYVILDVGNGYGGGGDWQWSVPPTSGAGPPEGHGIYGHGAVMLPGDVLMITGGYTIAAASRHEKRATPVANPQTYFLNITSQTWMTNYSSPLSKQTSHTTDGGPLSTTGQKIGLGIGLSLGLIALAGLLAFYIWHTRRMKRQREMSEKQLHDTQSSTHGYDINEYSSAFDGREGHVDAIDFMNGQNGSYYFPQGNQGGQGWRAGNGGDAERTGLLVEIPSPTRGLRRSLSGRAGYAMGRTRGPGPIHPIDELEEESEDNQIHDGPSKNNQSESTEKRASREMSALDDTPVLDLFIGGRHRRDRRRTLSPPRATSHEQGLDSTSMWSGGAEHSPDRLGPISGGRISPDKSASERTSSNLSERSTRSDLSWTSSSGSLVHNAPMRSAAVLSNTNGVGMLRSTGGSSTHDRSSKSSETGHLSPDDPRTQSLSSIRSNVVDVDSFRTAHSSFIHLQAEGEALLGGNPERTRPGTSSSSSNTFHDTEGTDSRAATATPATSFGLDVSAPPRPATRERRRSWLGSVRKVLTRSTSGADRTRTRSLTTAVSHHEPYTDNPTSPGEPLTNDEKHSFVTASATPRRAASDASFWRNRRGKHDWLDEEQDSTWKRNAGDDWGAPEDIAMAERERQRQEWRDRGNLLVNIENDDRLPTPRTPIRSDQLGVPASDDRPCTPASEADWDVEAAVERRVVQVMFTVPKSKLRVVNADVDGSSVLSVPRDGPRNGGDTTKSEHGSPNRVKDLAGRFEQLSGQRRSPRTSPRPSPSPSIKSMKLRPKSSSGSLGRASDRISNDLRVSTKTPETL